MSVRVKRIDNGGLVTLVLNRPDKLNALDLEAFTALDAHCRDLEQQTDTVGCVVLRGEGRGFCSGADLGDINAAAGPSAYKAGVIDRVAALPQPVIAAVHGVCYTGGLELALAADFMVADATARFADTHGKWGLVGAWGMIQRLPRRIGRPAAMRMMMTTRVVKAEEALAIGLVDQLAPAGELDSLIASFTGEILGNSWHTNTWTKRILHRTDGMTLNTALADERAHYPGFSADHAERVKAFAKK